MGIALAATRHPLPSRPKVSALANGQCLPRTATCFPTVRRMRMENRDPARLAEAQAIAIRFGMEPSSRHHGGDPHHLEYVTDRGTISTAEAVDFTIAHGRAAAALAIRNLPCDHVEFSARSKLHKDSPWSPVTHAIVGRDPSQELGRQRACLREDGRSSVARCSLEARRPATVRGGCGLEARAARRGDPVLQEAHTPAPVHLCGPGPLFPPTYTPRRGADLP